MAAKSNPEVKWLAKVALTGIAMIGLAWTMNRFMAMPSPPALTTDEQNRRILEAYYRAPSARLVLAGTSLMYRLSATYAESDNVSNIALPGESPVTDLRVVAEQSTLPEFIVVETNILPRVENLKLESEFRPSRLRELSRLKPVRWLAAWRHYVPAEPKQNALLRKQAILAERPAPSQPAPEHLVTGWNTRIPEEQLRTTAHDLIALADELEQRGARVFLVDLPMCDDLENSWLATRSRKIMREAVGYGYNRILNLQLERGQLRWSDCAHLDERSAILVLKAIERELRLAPSTTGSNAILGQRAQ